MTLSGFDLARFTISSNIGQHVLGSAAVVGATVTPSWGSARLRPGMVDIYILSYS